MLTHHCDSLCATHPIDTLLRQHKGHRYYVEVPTGSIDEQSQLIEQVIHFALDTLSVRHLDVRVLAADRDRGVRMRTFSCCKREKILGHLTKPL